MIAVENIVSVGFDLASFSAIMVLMVTGLGVIATSARALSAAASARCSRLAARS